VAVALVEIRAGVLGEMELNMELPPIMVQVVDQVEVKSAGAYQIRQEIMAQEVAERA
jgi:hypothetical protein